MKNKLKRLLAVGLSMIVFAGALSVQAFGSVIPDTIRVGLEYKYKNVAFVPIQNQHIAFGAYEGDRFIEEAEFETDSSFQLSVTSSSYGAVDREFESYEDAQDLAEEYLDNGFSAAPAYFGEGVWHVYIKEDNGSLDSTVESAESRMGDSISIVPSTGKDIELTDETGLLAVFTEEGACPQFQALDDNGIITLSDRGYRGAIEVGVYTGSTLTAVNVVEMDDYLYGVVASEMPASWPEEALKAQAVAARTYALSRLHAHEDSGYQLCDGTNCQVYKGYGNESESTNQAVDATSGQVMLYGGEPINAVFCSSSGGFTENAENVWTEAVPYLRGVPELNETDAKEWTVTFSEADINQRISGDGIGTVVDIEISSADETSGRIQEICIVGTNGTKVLQKDEIKTFFGIDSRMFTINGVGSPLEQQRAVPEEDMMVDETATNVDEIDWDALLQDALQSTQTVGDDYIIGTTGNNEALLEALEQNARKTAENTVSRSDVSYQITSHTPTTGSTDNGSGVYVFEGRGWGHGVGMSQAGAKGMAEMGYGYQDILLHYYTDITIADE